ncbi:hypothetical protein HAX54_006504 [Datura stramonium]|uniref:Uncharacterized protein n=1 Tax=Datura stramonium TaxID=4076 RepID=A0ABS8TBQ0_DATST|nr:hypothetical protein [Datura stramonium]
MEQRLSCNQLLLAQTLPRRAHYVQYYVHGDKRGFVCFSLPRRQQSLQPQLSKLLQLVELLLPGALLWFFTPQSSPLVEINLSHRLLFLLELGLQSWSPKHCLRAAQANAPICRRVALLHALTLPVHHAGYSTAMPV